MTCNEEIRKNLKNTFIFRYKTLLEIFVISVAILCFRYNIFCINTTLLAIAIFLLSYKCLEQSKIIKDFVSNDKNNFPSEISKYLMLNKDKQIAGFCTIKQDCSHKPESILQRQHYAAIITHDLKTPILAQIRSLESLLNDNNSQEEKRELTSLTLDSCRYVYKMLCTFLNICKLENNDFDINIKPCNIVRLVEDVINHLDNDFQAKELYLHIKKEGNICDVKCDEKTIIYALKELLFLTFNYADSNGNVNISLKNEKDLIDVKIISKGKEINSSLLENLLKKYISNSAKYNKVGEGLDLYFTQQIIRANSGSIYVKRENNENIIGIKLPMYQSVKV